MHKYDFKKRADDEVMDMDGYAFRPMARKCCIQKTANGVLPIPGNDPNRAKGMLNVNAIQVKIDPAAEWAEIFDEVWRVNRDYFYDPGMHGNDWAAVKKKYAVFLPDLACRDDLNLVIQWMCSELSVGHHRITDLGDKLYQPEMIKGGLLGADYTIGKQSLPD